MYFLLHDLVELVAVTSTSNEDVAGTWAVAEKIIKGKS